MKLAGIREQVFLDRYSLKDEKGNPIEKTPEEMWKRIALGVAKNEKKKEQKYWADKFYQAMEEFKFVPGGRILAGGGTAHKVTFYNCFVIPSPQDSRGGILTTLSQMVEIMARGGGVGINLSSLRPRGARVKKVNGTSSGPINWAELFSVATHDIIQQGGTRRGALMLMLWDWHPDVEEFITVKKDLSRIVGANLSVCVSDRFMEAVEKDDDWYLRFPDIHDPDYDDVWNGDIFEWEKKGKKTIIHKTIKARTLWDLICESAWASAEPGVVFMERYNKLNNNWYYERINCVNPCVTGDTLVATTNGLIPMKKLYDRDLPFRVQVNGENYLATKPKLTGVKKVYRLITREGYQLRLTSDHKVVTVKGEKEAGKLTPGDEIMLSKDNSFGTTGTEEEGQVLGWLVGDGAMKKDVATLYFYKKEKQELAPRFALMVGEMIGGEQINLRAYPIAPQFVEKEDKAVVESVRLWRIANRYGITHDNKYIVPEGVFSGSKEMQQGFLQGLFSSDGTVIGNPAKGVSVRLTSVSDDLLVGAQRLLLNFGIYSKIYRNRRKEGFRKMPDGHGGLQEYNCQAYHELVISKDSLYKFSDLINFLQEEKREKLFSLISLYKRGPYREKYTATFEKLDEEGEEEVFDITVESIHRFSANGLTVLNCGEEGLPPWGVCNLGSLNLAAFVEEDRINYTKLQEAVRTALRFLDNIIDLDIYVFEGIRKVQLEGERRVGLGTMGLGDALIKMKIRYGSEESLSVIEKIYATIRDAAYETSVQLAREKGPFPKFNAKKYSQGQFIKRLPDKLQKMIAKYGTRNSIMLQQAPTGSTSLLAGVSSGIEPIYEFSFIRRDRLGEHVLYHSLYEEWKKDHPDAPTPEYFVSANNLTPEDHVKIQATIQYYTDASISKTVNAPKTHTVEDVKKLYALAYKLGCKGIAYMREGSRPGVLEREMKSAEAKKTDGKQVKMDGQIVPEKKPRPVKVSGATYQIETPVGIAYVTINTNGGEEPIEVFINVGKGGSDVAAMTEAIGRLMSLVLRVASPVPAKERAKLIFNELIGISGARPIGFGEKRVRSLPDAIAKALGLHFEFKIKNGHADIAKTVEVKQISIPHVNSTEILTTITATAQNYDLCPSCGEAALAYEEGCKKCYSCGYSEC